MRASEARRIVGRAPGVAEAITAVVAEAPALPDEARSLIAGTAFPKVAPT